MNRFLTSCTVTLVALLCLCIHQQGYADVFASNVRFTQPTTSAPFDGKFNDGTIAAIRFVLSDHADSVIVNIKLGATPIRTIKAFNYSVGDTLVLWDGKNDAAADVATGDYSVQIVAYDKGYGAYTEVSYPDAAGLSMRGMTTVTNPALKNFGFIFDVDNGGVLGAVGVCRFTSDGKPWGNSQGVPKLDNTGIVLGPGEARWGSQADKDGYVYVLGRTAKQVYRYHTDTMNVIVADSGYGAYYPYGIAIREDAVGKTIAVVANTNSGIATLTGDSKVFTFRLNSAASTYFGTKDTLLNGLGTVMYWDAAFGRDSIFYATFIYPGDIGRSGIAKFNLAGKTLPLTLADTVWTIRVDSGRVGTCHYFFGSAPDGSNDKLYFVNARIAASNPPSGQGIYVLTGLNNARPTMAVAYADKQNNASITRSDISTDPVGNIVYFENSNEEIAVISPPTGPNNYTTNALSLIRVFNSITIAQARVDGNGDFQPDSLGKTVTISGIVNSLNTQGASGLQYNLQDETAGIMLFKSGAPAISLKIGDRVLITGVIQYFRGSTEITPANVATDVKVLDSGYPLTPITVTIPQLVKNGESYEARFIKIVGIAKKATSPAWPAAGVDANMMFWDGYDSLVVRLDKDCQVSGTTEPTYPVTVQGVATQFTSSTTVYNDGYQITPNFATDFTGNIVVSPNPHFALLAPANNSRVKIDSASQTLEFKWRAAVDLNKDTLIYQWIPVGFAAVGTGNAARDTSLVRTGTQLLTYLGASDSVVLRWTAKVKDPANPIVTNVDTFSVKLVRGTIVGVAEPENVLPAEFALAQNYPNPFNPTTTIRFALPTTAFVSLKIYDVLGQEVNTLVNEEKPAGYLNATWNGQNKSGMNIATGIYFYRLEARPLDGGKTFTSLKKMLLLK